MHHRLGRECANGRPSILPVVRRSLNNSYLYRNSSLPSMTSRCKLPSLPKLKAKLFASSSNNLCNDDRVVWSRLLEAGPPSLDTLRLPTNSAISLMRILGPVPQDQFCHVTGRHDNRRPTGVLALGGRPRLDMIRVRRTPHAPIPNAPWGRGPASGHPPTPACSIADLA